MTDIKLSDLARELGFHYKRVYRMKVIQAFRYELKPNNKQRTLLIKTAGVARFAYNWGLTEKRKLWEEEKKQTNAIELHRKLNRLKKTEFPWMYEVSKCAPQEALRDLDQAFENFFRGLKERKKVGFPRFKKKGRDDSFRLTGSIKVKEKAIRLPRLGRIRLKEGTSKFRGRILSATIKREANRWFVSLHVEVEIPDLIPRTGDVVGIDLGINNFATIHDGRETWFIESPKPLAKKLRLLRKRSRKHSRKQIGSNNKKKSALRLARLYRKIRNIRQDFLHKLSTQLAKTKSAVIVEGLNVEGMLQNGHLSRSISDEGWGEFRRMLGYKTQWYGSRYVELPPFLPTSRMCSRCGALNEHLSLSERKWICLKCSTFHDRDGNAAQNIYHLGFKILTTASSAGSNACGEERLQAFRPVLLGEAGSKHCLGSVLNG